MIQRALLATSVALFLSPVFAPVVTAQSAAIAAAVAHAGRPEADRADDAARKPGEVLDFFEVTPGMRVLDLLAGGGYYTEILSRTVGGSGSVLFHNNQAYLSFLGAAVGQRTAGKRLANVEAVIAEVNDLELGAASLDAVVFILGFHDIYFKDDSWNEIDGAKLVAKLYAALRPAGLLGIVDHSAKAGAEPWDSGTNLHRIDEAFTTRQIEAAGFVLEKSSDILRNSADDRSVLVFDPSIRRKTDRFVLRFRKPA